MIALDERSDGNTSVQAFKVGPGAQLFSRPDTYLPPVCQVLTGNVPYRFC